MEHDLQIHTDDTGRLWSELTYIVEFFRTLGCARCELLFGWAWRTEASQPDLSFKSVNVPLLELDAEVRGAEDAGLGNFAEDDVWISFEGQALKVQFCHHSGIHLLYPEPNDITEQFFSRWQAEGLHPVEFEKAADPLKWCRVRGEGT